MFGFTKGLKLLTSTLLSILLVALSHSKGYGDTFNTEGPSSPPQLKPEVSLYMEGLRFEKEDALQQAAEKYQGALNENPGFQLASKRLDGLAPKLVTDHRTVLRKIPGYTPKPDSHDKLALKGPIWFKDTMPGYLMIYNHPQTGPYGVYALKLKFMKNIHYLIVQEDESWQKYPTLSLPATTRYNDIIVYHQRGEKLSDRFMNVLIQAYGETLD